MVDGQKVFERCVVKELRMTYYKDIMQSFHAVDVSSDEDFQRAYTYFYRVRRDNRWRCEYFSYMESVKNEAPPFRDVLNTMYHRTGYVEPSFSSKLLATINPELPIWDSIVLRHLGYTNPSYYGKTADIKIEYAVHMYERLCEWYADFLQSDEARKNIELFDTILPDYSWMSDTKKIDFLLWGDRDE